MTRWHNTTHVGIIRLRTLRQQHTLTRQDLEHQLGFNQPSIYEAARHGLTHLGGELYTAWTEAIHPTQREIPYCQTVSSIIY